MKVSMKFKVLSAVIFCFILAVTLCACKDKAPVSSEDNGTSLTTSTDDASSEGSSSDYASSTISSNPKPESSSVVATSSSKTSNSVPSVPAISSTTSTTTKTPAQIIVGKWRGSADMAPLFSQEGFNVDGAMMVTCEIEFTSGGVVYEIIDRDSLQTVYTQLFTSTLNDSMAQNGLSKEQFEANIGQTYDEYLTNLVQAAMNSVPQNIISAYKFEGDALYVRDQNSTNFEKKEYSLSGQNELTIIDAGLPIKYTRVS